MKAKSQRNVRGPRERPEGSGAKRRPRARASGGGAPRALIDADKLAGLTHIDETGRLQMVDVSDKAVTTREAVARGRITMSPEAFRAVRDATLKKGDALQAARLAGIMGAKRTSELIPLCHPLPLSHVDVALTADRDGYAIEALARTSAQTGVEMEALTAVALAALTMYDMVKAIDKGMVIGDIRLVSKRGGRSGDYAA